ncbi:TPA: DNA primase [Mannheimia haemolytica]|nr:DNA primase [Mannheimia haemolytica USDA-ARS-USMARC-184]EEY09286.1 phage DNA primase-like protein [Mannheimia haemolytica serotype A2 str. OVINE]EEY13032.1 phage DNA primase-like protein [Mannheimia haemolytica serotype A2 str. BOVINE]KYL07242.1 DNA primase [Mannheimia haemolytica]KYL15814.1 DNA primase [Mannheimia haemolytica]
MNAVFMTTNNTPILFTENSGGTERRRVIFKFDRIVPIEERDFNLIDKIQAETGGIIRLLFDTFPEPLEAKALLEKQRVSQEALAVKMEVNHVLEFAQEFEILPTVNGLAMGSSLNNGTRDSAIYPAYIYFCQLNDIEPINRRTFTRAFKQALKELDKGEYQTRESNGRTVTNVHYIDKLRTFNKWQG